MSPFAAGCAVCGADLDTRRWDSGPGPLTRAGSWLSALSFGSPNSRFPGVMLVIVLLFGGTILGLGLHVFG